MRTFAEASWLLEFCCNADSAESALRHLVTHPAQAWLVEELMAYNDDASLMHELEGIYSRVESEHELDDESTATEIEAARDTLAPMLAAHLQPFVLGRGEALLRSIEMIRDTAIPMPRACSDSLVFCRRERAVPLRYWQWGSVGRSEACVVFSAPDNMPTDPQFASVLDLIDRMESTDAGAGSLHWLHSEIARQWPELCRIPHWYLRARYHVFRRDTEVWLRFTDGTPVPVRFVLDRIRVAR